MYITPVSDDSLMDVLCQTPQFDANNTGGGGGDESPEFGIPARRLYI